jgi:hypothetical protein
MRLAKNRCHEVVVAERYDLASFDQWIRLSNQGLVGLGGCVAVNRGAIRIKCQVRGQPECANAGLDGWGFG